MTDDARPTPEQMRSMGYAADAEPVRLGEGAWLAFCAWVNLLPDKVPEVQRWKPAATAAAWQRVAEAVVDEAMRKAASKPMAVIRRQAFVYLDALRASGAVNMYGAAPMLERDLALSADAAKRFWREWADSFDSKRPAKERAASFDG